MIGTISKRSSWKCRQWLLEVIFFKTPLSWEKRYWEGLKKFKKLFHWINNDDYKSSSLILLAWLDIQYEFLVSKINDWMGFSLKNFVKGRLMTTQLNEDSQSHGEK